VGMELRLKAGGLIDDDGEVGAVGSGWEMGGVDSLERSLRFWDGHQRTWKW
jgi:hypothetical protein